MEKGWLKDIIRDVIALGSLPFFILVVARVWILPDFVSLIKLLLAGIFFLISFFIFKKRIIFHSGMGIILLIFLIFYYSNWKFTIFASLLYLGLLGSLIYLKKSKTAIFFGILIGAISFTISYFIIGQFFA